MNVEVVKQKATNVIFELGRGALHAMAPDDFEFYACTFELINSQGIIENIFHFPVMPNSISVSRNALVNIRKTGTAYLSQFNDSFVGKNISITGTFGRKFRLLLTKGVGANIGSDSDFFQTFDLNVKTGYGALKLMEKMIESSQQLDEYLQPKMLLFYNSALNQNHVVEVLQFQEQQSLESNMIWNYTLEMKMLAPVDEIIYLNGNKKHLYDLLAVSALNKSINKVFDNISLEGVTNTLNDIL